MRLFCKYFLLLVGIVLLSACQGEQENSTSTSSISKGEAETTFSTKKKETVPLEKMVEKEVDVVEEKVKKIVAEAVVETREKREEAAANVDLNVSGDYLEKLDKEDGNYSRTPPHPGETASGSSRKIEVRGGVLLDGREEDLTKKLDGGKVEISIPLN